MGCRLGKDRYNTNLKVEKGSLTGNEKALALTTHTPLHLQCPLMGMRHLSFGGQPEDSVWLCRVLVVWPWGSY